MSYLPFEEAIAIKKIKYNNLFLYATYNKYKPNSYYIMFLKYEHIKPYYVERQYQLTIGNLVKKNNKYKFYMRKGYFMEQLIKDYNKYKLIISVKWA